ncbi:unnamed protein product [Cylindrotheca closterium]|uniref:Uncharacterized protein n=1 Tax=Cylindrotheca closterium TaxID=2856 RepID=A0AAD2CHH1_9STRA|nr:unnamed protein product [Cylindrotheca closterium]
MNSYFTLEPFNIPEHKMTDEYPPDLSSDSSMSTVAAFEEQDDSTMVDTLVHMCDFDMPPGISANTSRHSSASPSIVTPTFKSLSATFQGEPFEPIPIAHAFEEQLHDVELEVTAPFQSMDTSYHNNVSSDVSTRTNKSASELDRLYKAGIEKLRESMKRSSATRQAVMLQRQALKF